MKTVKDLMEYLSQFSPDTRVVINAWDCYNDEPYEHEISDEPYVEEKREGPKGRRHYKVIHF